MAEKKDRRGPKERAYDAHMAPLVKQLIALSKEHKVPLIVAAELDTHPGEETNHMICRTVIFGEDFPLASKRMRDASAALLPERAVMFSMVVMRDPVPR